MSQPISELLSFNEIQLSKIGNLDVIEDLPVDELKTFAQTACIQGRNVNYVRSALKEQLADIPLDVRDEVVKIAILDKIDTRGSRQDTTSSTAEKGKAFSYKVFWSTAYLEEDSEEMDQYSTCIMVSGITIKVAEHVAGYDTKTRNELVGYKPCECGFFSCEKCPIYENVVTKTPIFKRHVLSLGNQKQLHKWMVREAIESAQGITGQSKGQWAIGMKRFVELKALIWNGPKDDLFNERPKVAEGKEEL